MTRISLLDPSRKIELLPGETGLNLKHDAFYGMVDVGVGGTRPESDRAKAGRIQRDIRNGVHVLDGDEQNHVEVMIGKRLQQKTLKREDLPPTGDLAAPTVTSLDPATAALGSPDFTLSVKGTGFDVDSVIVFAGQDEPTTLVSETEVTTGVNMAVWLGVDPAIPVSVRNIDDQMSNEMMFSFTEAAGGGAARSGESVKRQPVPPSENVEVPPLGSKKVESKDKDHR